MNQSAFIPFPMFMGGPQQSSTPDTIPARVRAAMGYLMDLSMKTMTRAAINDMAIEEIEGQKLTDPEREAQSAACRLLRDYFMNDTMPGPWEKGHATIPTDQPGMVMRCINCTPDPPRRSCVLCRGSGQILVFPSHGGGG